MIFMIVFEALTNGLKAAILVGTGLEALYFLDANVGERGGFTAVGAESGSGVVAGAGVLAVLLRFLLARAFRAFRAFKDFQGFQGLLALLVNYNCVDN